MSTLARLVAACACALLLVAAPAATAAPAKARGTLVVAVDAASAPYAFVDSDGTGARPGGGSRPGARQRPRVQAPRRRCALRHDHPGARLRRVRPRHVVRGHQGAGEGRRPRHLPLGGHVVLRQGPGGLGDREARGSVRALGRRRARDDAGRRRDRAERELHGDGQAGREGLRRPRPGRGAQARARERTGSGRDGRLRRRRLHRDAVARAVQAGRPGLRRGRFARSRSPRRTAWPRRCSTRCRP